MADDIKFIDAETNYSGGNFKDKLSFRDIALNTMQQIGRNANCEMKGGYWQEQPHPNPAVNATIKIYIPDTREVYSNEVEYFYDIMYIHFDKKTLETLQAIEEEKQKLKETSNIEDIQDRISYRTKRMRLNRKLFREMCCFLGREKYFEVGHIEQ